MIGVHFKYRYLKRKWQQQQQEINKMSLLIRISSIRIDTIKFCVGEKKILT